MIYTSLCVMILDVDLSASCHFTGPKKLSISRAQPPPALVMYLQVSKTLRTINHRCPKIYSHLEECLKNYKNQSPQSYTLIHIC
jgi:hypothetical protein